MKEVTELKIEFRNTITPREVVPQEKIPTRKLFDGIEAPVVGLGTFANDRFDFVDIAKAVYNAIHAGYRLIDCAAAYRNEPEIGQAFAAVLAGGIKREELFITSKLWNDKHAPKDVRPALEQTLKDLQLDYLDAYYIHWPYPNTHPYGAPPGYRDPNGKPYIHEEYMAAYREIEKAVDEGLVRYIGCSNMTMKKLGPVIRDARFRPAFNQIEMHPGFQQPEMVAFLAENKVLPVAFCPIGSPTRPDRDTAPGDVSVIEQPVIVEIAKAHNVHPAVICVKWASQRGQIPIPFSIYQNEYVSNLRSVTEDFLSDEEMRRIGEMDCKCRLIKGEPFLWKEAKTWHELWDGEA